MTHFTNDSHIPMFSLFTATFQLLNFTLCVFADIKIEHDSCGLCDGMDPSQQALLKGSENVSDGCGYWCWCLHCN